MSVPAGDLASRPVATVVIPAHTERAKPPRIVGQLVAGATVAATWPPATVAELRVAAGT